MIHVKKEGILLRKTDLGFEREGVLNPAVIQDNGKIYLFYRAVAKDNYSTIGYCELSSPLEVSSRHDTPLLFPLEEHESHGLEDPRIVKIDDVYYLTYTAYDGVNALSALATSRDLIHWERHGIVVPQITYQDFMHLVETKGKLNEKYIRYNDYQKSHDKQDRSILLWDKNLILFPRKINGNFCFLHRIKPDIQIVISVEDLSNLTNEFWRQYLLTFDESIVLRPKYEHEVSYIGGGCPPIETEEGWILIYHGVHDSIKGYIYTACAALLDLEHPQIEIARLPYPLFKPELEWEVRGEVNNVCFPTGALVVDDTIYIYYGAADERIAVAAVSKKELVTELLNNKV